MPIVIYDEFDRRRYNERRFDATVDYEIVQSVSVYPPEVLESDCKTFRQGETPGLDAWLREMRAKYGDRFRAHRIERFADAIGPG